jgi:hypothetical protein
VRKAQPGRLRVAGAASALGSPGISAAATEVCEHSAGEPRTCRFIGRARRESHRDVTAAAVGGGPGPQQKSLPQNRTRMTGSAALVRREPLGGSGNSSSSCEDKRDPIRVPEWEWSGGAGT